MRVNFVAMKWGSAFSPETVNSLYLAVKKNYDGDFKFHCFTDDSHGIFTQIDCRPIPDMDLTPTMWRSGCWAKLSVFKPGLFPDRELVIFLDLDLMIIGRLEPIVEAVRRTPGLTTLREWNPWLLSLLPLFMRPDRGVQSAVFGFESGTLDYIYHDFVADKERARSLAFNDQRYLTKVARNRSYLSRKFYVSFKHDCVDYYPLSLLRPIRKPNTSIIVFHGRPRPWELCQAPGIRWGTPRKFDYNPVAWVVEYYESLKAVASGLAQQGKHGQQEEVQPSEGTAV
ncbi:MAG: hypothetical protein ACK4ZU_17600 [Allorhizobium sp.]